MALKKPKQSERQKFVSAMRKLRNATIVDSPPLRLTEGLPNNNDLPNIDQRIKQILGIVNNPNRKPTNMLFFVMYDITNNKVRNLVVKYLIKKGCTRIQKSIFLADLDSKVYEQIKIDLTEVQQTYENNDSILLVPVSTEYLRSMKIIGQTIELDMILKARNTLFF